MSIPIFYESFFFEKAALSADLFNTIKDQNQESLAAFFIDGGVVSNFPINVFHNPKIRTPRIPVIGIRLNDGIEPTEKDIFKSMISYVYRIFNTIRYHSDKEFLRQYQFYQEHCVHEVNLKGFNWLNFAMNDEEKKLLFAKGVSAGLKFIQEFNWEQYTAAREKLFDSTT